jgi:hypothetical protein
VRVEASPRRVCRTPSVKKDTAVATIDVKKTTRREIIK